MRSASLLAVVLVCTTGCGADDAAAPAGSSPCGRAASPGAPFGVQCGELVDAAGRVVRLRGVNARVDGVFDVTFDDGRTAVEPIPAFDANDATALRDFGFDALRLPINWSALEPTKDGGFDEQYLDRVQGVVDTAAAAGLLVLLDFHQDAYSKEIGEDGAPLWAIVPPPTELLQGPLGPGELEQRRLSKQVLAAFDTFFGESPEGDELRSRFTAAAVHVAERFASHDAVVGIEIFNEPQATDAGVARLNAVAHPALRAAAPDKLYVFEPPVTRNILDASSVPDEPLGPMTGYAPHVYTLAFTGTDAQYQTMNKEMLRRSHENARIEADAWQAPLLETEWGFDPNATRADEYLTWQSELAAEYGASTFFWVWKEQSQGSWGCFDYDAAANSWTERGETKKALARVRAARVAGWPTAESFDRASGTFELSFTAHRSLKAPHQIAVAPLLGAPTSVTCDGADVPFESPSAGLVEVSCGEGSGEHVLRVEVAPMP